LSLILREAQKLKELENRVLRRICVPKREEVIRSWRKLHERFCNLYSSPNIIGVVISRRMS
jgi:hypothetical protein